MICLSVSRSPHASARPSSVASISTRRACATSLKHSSPCPPRPTASPPPTLPLGCAFSVNKALFRTAPATLPTISKNSAANRSFSGSPALAGTTHSRPAFAQWPPSWCFATKPSNPCSLPFNLSAQPAARTTRDPSTPTTVPYRLPCTASSTSSALPLEYRQFFCRASPLSAYTKGQRVLRIEAVVHNTRELKCGRALDKFPEVVGRLKAILQRFADALSCIDQCFIADDMLEQLPLAAQVGKTRVRGVDLNKARMRYVVEAVIAFAPSANGFTASQVAAQVRLVSKLNPLQYSPRHAAYDLKKLRGKHIVQRIGRTCRYETLPTGLRAMTALIVLRNKAIKPLLAAARPLRPARGSHNPKPIDAHYQTIQGAMRGIFHELGLAA